MIEQYYEIHLSFYDYEHTNKIVKTFNSEEEFLDYLKHVKFVLDLQGKGKYTNSYWINWGHEEFGWGILYYKGCYKTIREKLGK